ncbi:MAG: hypothetical protein HC877_01250 [Thioploca sp.]|nr:hypothetical protein [Thioploca sp.]
MKRNQPKLDTAIAKQTLMTHPTPTWSGNPKGHGHPVKCRIKVSRALEEIKPIGAGLQQVMSVNRQGQRKGKTINTTTYYLTSESSSA